jgi:hypothetical protein
MNLSSEKKNKETSTNLPHDDLREFSGKTNPKKIDQIMNRTET